jgi:hypothetical protein
VAEFTQTTHATWIPEQYADEMIVSYQMNLVMAKVVKHVTHDKKTKGDIIHMPKVSHVDAVDLPESSDDLVGATPPTEGEFTLTINKAKHKTFYIPKFLGEQFVKYEIRSPYTKEIGYALAKVMDTDLFALYSGLSSKYGTTADGLEGMISDALILAAMMDLDENDVPDEGRVMVLAARQKAKLLAIDKFVRADAVGPNAAKIEKAKFGEIYGMAVYFTNNCPVKAAATAPATVDDSHAGLMMHPEAFAIAIPQNIEPEYAWIPEKKCFLLSGDCLYGVAEFKDVDGIVVFTSTTD